MGPVDRTLVVVVGPEKVDTKPFDERRLALHHASPTDELAKLFQFARALVVSEREGDLAKIHASFRNSVTLAEQHGLAIIVLVQTEEESVMVDQIAAQYRNHERDDWAVKVIRRDQLADAAERAARAHVGPQQTEIPKIVAPSGCRLDEEQVILLQRAFYDCSQIRLEALAGGKASDAVFRAHAFCPSSIGPRPLPFFVKFGKPGTIEEERQNYSLYAEPYIPFGFRPNLDRRRCVRGAKSSALVGNFVEDAVPLLEHLRTRAGDGVLFSLFATTLRGLRNQPFCADSAKKKTGHLANFITLRIHVNSPPAEIEPRVFLRAKELGFKADNPAAMEAKLCKSAENLPTWWGPIHGDLHAGNVMVRGTEAVLIDFGSVINGPLTGDLAALEVSLIFRAELGSEWESWEAWMKLVAGCYETLPEVKPPVPEVDSSTFSWIRRAIRELRHIHVGCDCHKGESEAILATYLMRFARLLRGDYLKRASYVRESQHAFALVVAEKIIDSLQP